MTDLISDREREGTRGVTCPISQVNEAYNYCDDQQAINLILRRRREHLERDQRVNRESEKYVSTLVMLLMIINCTYLLTGTCSLRALITSSESALKANPSRCIRYSYSERERG